MKKTIAALAAMLAAAGACYGQSTGGDNLNRRVDVARNYAPDVAVAGKLNIMPNMVDTVRLRPESEYSVKPRAWVSRFEVSEIRAAQVDASTVAVDHPFYLKLGGGYPGQSVADLYLNSVGSRNGSFGLYVNHVGRNNKIENDLGRDMKALMTTNRVGVFGRAKLGRISLAGEVGYDHDVWSRYGNMQYVAGGVGEPPVVKNGVPMQHYSVPRGSFGFGHDFKDLSYFNFSIGADAFHLTDRYDNKEAGVSGFFKLGKMFSVHKIMLDGEIGNWSGSGRLKGERSTVFNAGPSYGLSTASFDFTLGGRFAVDMPGEGDNKTWFLPHAGVSLTMADGHFIPYAKLDSRLENNSYRAQTLANPYIDPSDPHIMRPTAVYNLRGGARGSIGLNFAYNIFAGADVMKDKLVFLDRLDFATLGNRPVSAVDERVSGFVAGAELEGRISGSFSAVLNANYYKYSSKSYEKPVNMPEFTASLELKYNYRDKLCIRAGAQVVGRRYFLEESDMIFDVDGYITQAAGVVSTYEERKPVVDLSLMVDYFIIPKLGIFVEGRNLANQRLYPFNHYRGNGMSVSAGVKLLF